MEFKQVKIFFGANETPAYVLDYKPTLNWVKFNNLIQKSIFDSFTKFACEVIAVSLLNYNQSLLTIMKAEEFVASVREARQLSKFVESSTQDRAYNLVFDVERFISDCIEHNFSVVPATVLRDYHTYFSQYCDSFFESSKSDALLSFWSEFRQSLIDKLFSTDSFYWATAHLFPEMRIEIIQ